MSAMPAATLTMLASETPALVNRCGCLSRNGSRTLKPRSAVSRWTSAPSEASSLSVATTVLRMVELCEGCFVLFRIGAAVVPEERVLHERDALSLDGVGHDDARFAGLEGRRAQGVDDGGHVVTVDAA